MNRILNMIVYFIGYSVIVYLLWAFMEMSGVEPYLTLARQFYRIKEHLFDTGRAGFTARTSLLIYLLQFLSILFAAWTATFFKNRERK